MKGLFKSKLKTPAELVRNLRDLLVYVNTSTETRQNKRDQIATRLFDRAFFLCHCMQVAEVSKLILEMRTVLYGSDQSEPNSEACAKLTVEFFKEDTMRLLISSIPTLELGARQDATHVIANLQRQRVNSQSVAADYLENNLDLVDILVPGYEDSDLVFTYGALLRDCMRHQIIAKYIMESQHMFKFFDYIQSPNFDIASDAAATFKELLTRHRSTVAEFLSRNYDWFFQEYTKLLESPNYITRRHAVKLLGAMLLDRSNCPVMVRFVSSLENLMILMNLLRDSNKTIQLEAFHVFKLFAANQNKPPEIVNVLVTNRSKLLRFFSDFTCDREDEQFEADKAHVVKEIATLEAITAPSEACEIPS